MNIVLPFPVATATQGTAALTADLGKLYIWAGKTYRLAKISAALASAAAKVLVTAVSAGDPTWLVTTTTTANNGLVCGVVPQSQVGSDNSTGLLINDFFLMQVAGACKVITLTASVAVGTCFVTTTTAGSADAVSATYAATTQGSIFAKSTLVSIVGQTNMMLQGLI